MAITLKDVSSASKEAYNNNARTAPTGTASATASTIAARAQAAGTDIKPAEFMDDATTKAGDTWLAINLPPFGGQTTQNGTPVLTEQQRKDRANTVVAAVVVVVLLGVVVVLASTGKKAKKKA